jgi:hypothetical protein
MVPIKRILRDYERAGTVSGLVSLWGFLDEHAFLTTQATRMGRRVEK